MYETNKLRGRIVEKFGSQKEFSKVANCSLSFLSQYLNGKFTINQKTMDKWIEILEIPSEDIHEYFFTHKVGE